MANTIKMRRSGVPGKVPEDLAIGELALNFADGILYFKVVQDGVDKLYRLIAQDVDAGPEGDFGSINQPVTASFNFGGLGAVTETYNYGAL